MSTDPVFSGIAEGLKPRADTISVSTLALIGIDANLGRIERLQEQIAKAADRQADALENLVGLFASCIGVSTAWCPGEPKSHPVVNYFRASSHGKSFRCDQEKDTDDE